MLCNSFTTSHQILTIIIKQLNGELKKLLLKIKLTRGLKKY